MNIVGIIGASALRERSLVEEIILSLRFDGWSVSTLKRAPDGFDIDQPGKVSHRRREAGCREVMLVGDRRLALMMEFRDDPQPSLEWLAARRRSPRDSRGLRCRRSRSSSPLGSRSCAANRIRTSSRS